MTTLDLGTVLSWTELPFEKLFTLPSVDIQAAQAEPLRLGVDASRRSVRWVIDPSSEAV